MNKILFVEDEINKNIKQVILMFKPVLSPNEIKDLEDIENSSFPYSIDKFRDILKHNLVLQIENNFINAIDIINSNERDEYDLFVIDRNLTDQDHPTEQQIQQHCKDYTNELYLKKEGDFLFKLLCDYGVEVERKVFFYSAYSPDNLPIEPIQRRIIAEKYFKVNFMDKNSPDTLCSFCKNVVSSNERAITITKFGTAFEGLEKIKIAGKYKNITQQKNALIDILINNKGDYAANAGKLRCICDLLLKPSKNKFPTGIPSKKLKDNCKIWEQNALKVLNANGNENSIVPLFIADHLFELYELTCNYAAHPYTGNNPPNNYTLQAQINQMLEVLTWINKVF